MKEKSPVLLKLIRGSLEISTFRGHDDACIIHLTFPLSASDSLWFAADSPYVYLERKNKYPVVVGTAKSRDSFVDFIYDFLLNIDI